MTGVSRAAGPAVAVFLAVCALYFVQPFTSSFPLVAALAVGAGAATFLILRQAA